MFWQTNFDVLVILLFGGPCVIHWKRGVFFENIGKTHVKYMVVLKQFGFILLQMLELVLAIPCIILNWSKTIALLKLIID